MSYPRAVGHRLIVLVDSISDDGEKVQKQGDLIVTTSTSDYEREREFQGMGKVVEMGKECYTLACHKEPWCSVGDKVLFRKYGGQTFKDFDTDRLYRILNDEDVLAIIIEE